MRKIAASNFVKRQTAESRFSHYDKSWEELEMLVGQHFSEARKGYREGVLLVTVPPDNFWSSVVPIDDKLTIVGRVEKRQEKEQSVLVVVAKGSKVRAGFAEVVLYSHALLAEDNDASTDSEWEIISVNASPDSLPTPQSPSSMARNSLALAGGTKVEYPPEEWARSVWFWATHVQVE